MGNNTLQWMIARRRASDWFCWNAFARIAFPAGCAALLLIIGLEAASGGVQAVGSLFERGFGLTVLFLLLAAALTAFLLFALQGSDILECTLDGKGAHLRIYLPSPTPFRMILRGLPPGAISRIPGEPAQTASLDVSWKEIRRVQLWPEQGVILLYAPRFWLRVYLPCAPDTWNPALVQIRDRLGRKKQVRLPACLRTAETKHAARKKASAPSADLMAEIRAMNAEAEKRDAASADETQSPS